MKSKIEGLVSGFVAALLVAISGASLAELAGADSPAPAKKKRGRPPGSKNKTKPAKKKTAKRPGRAKKTAKK